jgi:Zn-dependent alcohol dehydrogenase
LKESLHDRTSLHSRPHHFGAAGILGCVALTAVAAVRELTHGGADVAFEAVGRTETFAQTSRMLADGGRMVAIGIAAGSSTAEIEITPLVRRGYSITGSFGGRTRTDLPEVVALAANGVFDTDTVISRRCSLENVNKACQALLELKYPAAPFFVIAKG